MWVSLRINWNRRGCSKNLCGSILKRIVFLKTLLGSLQIQGWPELNTWSCCPGLSHGKKQQNPKNLKFLLGAEHPMDEGIWIQEQPEVSDGQGMFRVSSGCWHPWDREQRSKSTRKPRNVSQLSQALRNNKGILKELLLQGENSPSLSPFPSWLCPWEFLPGDGFYP